MCLHVQMLLFRNTQSSGYRINTSTRHTSKKKTLATVPNSKNSALLFVMFLQINLYKTQTSELKLITSFFLVTALI